MAQYRLSASVIKRTDGRSVTAAAAYRAAEAIHDQRTGIIHDYSRKSGVLRAEIFAPKDTPEWMLDRHHLWNAVEAVEKRKDAQLAREITLSLPHELNDRQRWEVIRAFVQERYVDRGMIADVAMHAPGRGTDERNHHAHILLTMRELTGEGFGRKQRTNEFDRIADLREDREAWARHQNRAFERLNMPERVDHRSYADRGIDRLPTQHLGPTATQMERASKPSRIGDENRNVVARNSRVAESYRAAADVDTIRKPERTVIPMRRPVAPVFNYYAADRKLGRKEQLWAEREHQRRMQLEERERHQLIDLQFKHTPQMARLEHEQEIRNGTFRRTVTAEIEAIDARAKAKGVTRFFRTITGRTRADAEARALHEKTLAKVAERELQERQELQRRQEKERLVIIERYRGLRRNLEDNIAMLADRRRKVAEAPMKREDERKRAAEAWREAKADRETARDKAREQDRPVPKPVPVLKPAPPRGAGRPLMPPDPAAHERNYQRWANSPEGRKAGTRHRRLFVVRGGPG